MGQGPHGAYSAHRRTTRDKVHRRERRLGGRVFSVLSLRPSTRHRFATNRFHDTWHILCDAGSAHFLARLLWALSFQRPNTVLVIDHPFLVPNPFDADLSRPFAFVNTTTTPFGHNRVDDLARALPLRSGRAAPHPDGTVVMNSRSRQAAIGPDSDFFRRLHHRSGRQARRDTRGRTWDRADLIVFGHTANQLRTNSVRMDRFNDFAYRMDYLFLDDGVDGEIQTFDCFSQRVARAQRRREQVHPGRSEERLGVEERRQVWYAETSA